MAFAIALYPASSIAEEPASCVAPPALDQLKTGFQSAAKPVKDTNEILISSDSARVIESETTIFEGNVVVEHRGRKIWADRASYHQPSSHLDLKGNVRIESAAGDIYEPDQGSMNVVTEKGSFDNGRFFFKANNSRGQAAKMKINADKSVTFESVRFSTCPADRETWSFKFARLTLDRVSDDGIGHHAVLSVKGVPVFYTPYLRFPLGNRRKSGLLIPEYGSDDKVGTVFALPYYLNLAPNYDATITPRWMSKRGLQGESEFRYLNKNYSGKAELRFLSKDLISNSDRSFVSLNHNHQLSEKISSSIAYQEVSDTNYFNDLAIGHLGSSPTHLQRSANVNYDAKTWALNGKLVDYQILDTTLTGSEIPYRRLPQLDLQMNPFVGNTGFSGSLETQFSLFQHPTLESANRFNINPSISYPIYRSWGHLIPELTGYYTSYQDRSVGSDSTVTSNIFSIDSGLVFERRSKRKSGWSQTLEPRLFYVNSPYVEQSTLPIFDTAEAEFNFDTLFRKNRFIGGDRIGDSNHLTLAIGSRWIDENQNERLHFQLGQVNYFEDRKVSALLPAAAVQTRAQSLTAAEISGEISKHWYARSTVSWDSTNSQTNYSRQSIQYQPDKNRIINLAYRYANNSGDSADLSGQWKLGSKWSLYSRLRHDLSTQTNLNSYAGVLYQSCCWSIRTLASRRVDNTGQQINAFEFQVTLTGLGGNASMSDLYRPLSQSVFFDN